MTTPEKVAYIKGLFDGLDIDKETKEGKLFAAIIDVLEDIALDLEDMDENALDLSEEIDELSDDLAALEGIIYDDDEDDDEDDDFHSHGCDCGCDSEPLFFEVKCPACENEITIDEEVLELGAIDCPNCGETLEFDLTMADEDEEGED